MKAFLHTVIPQCCQAGLRDMLVMYVFPYSKPESRRLIYECSQPNLRTSWSILRLRVPSLKSDVDQPGSSHLLPANRFGAIFMALQDK